MLKRWEVRCRHVRPWPAGTVGIYRHSLHLFKCLAVSKAVRMNRREERRIRLRLVNARETTVVYEVVRT